MDNSPISIWVYEYMSIWVYEYMPHESYSSTLATSNNNVTSAAEAKFPSGE